MVSEGVRVVGLGRGVGLGVPAGGAAGATEEEEAAAAFLDKPIDLFKAIFENEEDDDEDEDRVYQVRWVRGWSRGPRGLSACVLHNFHPFSPKSLI